MLIDYKTKEDIIRELLVEKEGLDDDEEMIMDYLVYLVRCDLAKEAFGVSP